MGLTTTVEQTEGDTKKRFLVWVIVLLAYGSATYAQTMPGPSQLDTHFATNTGDPAFIMWTLDTGASNLTANLTGDLTNPLYGNIFHPREDTLAYSDNLLAFAPLWAVASAVGGHNPVLAYNAVTFLTYLAGGVVAFAFARWLLRSEPAAFIAGLVFTLTPYRSVMLSHIQLAGFVFAIGALWATARFLRDRRLIDAGLAGVSVAGLWYSASYYALAMAIALPVFILAWMIVRAVTDRDDGGRPIDRSLFVGGATFAGAVIVLVGPTLPAYLRLQNSGLFERGPAEILRAQWFFWRQLPPSWLWGLVAHRECCQGDRGGYYPGIVVIVLVLVAIGVAICRLARRASGRSDGVAIQVGDDPPPWVEFRWPLIVTGAVFVPLMFGPALPADSWAAISDVVPGLASVRDVGRFWLFPALSLALLAGRGAAVVLADRPERLAWAFAAVALVVTWGDLVYRPRLTTIDRSATELAVYEQLATMKQGVVTELPVVNGHPAWPFIVAPRQVRGRIDENPRVEGYSGTLPPDVVTTLRAGRAVPHPDALKHLRWLGVRYLLIHGSEAPCPSSFGPSELDALLTGLRAQPEVIGVRPVPGSMDVIVELARSGSLDTDEIPPAPIESLPGATEARRGALCEPL